jgi:hypothetical protein
MKLAHPLLQRGAQVTEDVWIWTLKEHPHRLVGTRRGFDVCIYENNDWVEPYLVSMTDQANGYVMNLDVVSNADAAEALALEMLAALDGALPSTQKH